MRFVTVLLLAAVMLSAGTALADPPLRTMAFFSEYIEGSSNNKALEIYNNTSEALLFSRLTLERYNNGATEPDGTYELLPIMVASQDVYVIANVAADPAILAVADDTENSGATWYNGDDVLLLYLDNVLIDSIGVLGEDPGSFWGTAPCVTQDATLVRMNTICEGDNDPYDAFDPATEFDCYDVDTFIYLGEHTANCSPVDSEDASWGQIKALYR